MTAGWVLSEEELAALFADAAGLDWAGVNGRPLPAVLDTDFVRTGLHHQLSKGAPPRSVATARQGLLRLVMEYDTLAETGEKLPKFAAQFGVTAADLRRVLNQDWLPHIDVVKLPDSLRAADPRARQVRDRDPTDYPAAALAALLSPCLLLTHNYKHFGALGVLTRKQGVDGVLAVAAINVGEMRVHAVVMLPALPARAAGAAFKWASDRIGPVTWVVVAVVIGGGIYWYCKQPPGRRERIKQVAGEIGSSYLEQYGAAAQVTYQGRQLLRACLVPRPGQRSTASAILRELALASESLSAQQLAELLDPSVRPSVTDLRAGCGTTTAPSSTRSAAAASSSDPTTSCRARGPRRAARRRGCAAHRLAVLQAPSRTISSISDRPASSFPPSWPGQPSGTTVSIGLYFPDRRCTADLA